jgi:hypothetical protein
MLAMRYAIKLSTMTSVIKQENNIFGKEVWMWGECCSNLESLRVSLEWGGRWKRES